MEDNKEGLSNGEQPSIKTDILSVGDTNSNGVQAESRETVPAVEPQGVVTSAAVTDSEPKAFPGKDLAAGGRLSRFSRKQVLIGIVILVAVAAGAGGWLLLGRSQDKAEDNQSQSLSALGVTATLIDGIATYKSGDGAWEPLMQSTALAEGDYVSTDAGARVVLTFDDGSALRLDESTIIGLTSLAADDIRVEHISGTTYSRVVPSERSYAVNVDDMAYQALGTAFTTINGSTDKGVQVMQSSVKAGEETVTEGKQLFQEHTNADLKGKLTDIDLDELKSDGFMLWNLEQDEQSNLFKDKLGIWQKVKEQTDSEEPAEEDEQTPGASIKLTAVNSAKGTVLSWTVTGVDVSDGFKIVRSKKSSTPAFGRDEAQYVGDAGARTYTWKSDSEGTFWYRVCAYRPNQGSCTSYSNAVQMKAVYVAPEKVTRGTMSLTEDSGLLTWHFTGKAIYGYKLVMSTSPNPSYPDDGYVYYGDKTTHVIDLSGKPDGTYYFRVCAYTNGSETDKCVNYSDSVAITKP